MNGRLAQVFVPEGHQRYAELVQWSATADVKWWKFGKSSDGRSGIWIPYNKWDQHRMVARKSESTEPRSFALSEAALKVMREVDETRAWIGEEAAE